MATSVSIPINSHFRFFICPLLITFAAMHKIVLITGATSGFGKAIAEKFASNHWNCIITGRRAGRLHAFADELREKYTTRILSLVFDVQHKEEVFQNLSNLPDEWKEIDVLVNNAGLALGRDTVDKGNISDWDTMIDTNVKGLLYVTKAVLPYMTAGNKGHVINVGSIAGKEVYEKGNVYCATKFAVDALSRAMRIDLLPHKIKVTVVNPGAAETEFSTVRFKGDENKAKQVYDGFTPLYAPDIADIVWYCVSLPPHVCINELQVTCTAQASAVNLYKEQV
ncbi:MAG: Oxidoreductase, short-chain dehydrogenase/reductase family [uncultured Segetibacter sp.]|uniref:Oxidoreductase, short-chain dehydrogenase/reductase family n=1 Tax=uncultured Segetibacter sp. TaxID=481133 RepID=A0A6J4SP57_9BACT|nr:MAG: Oxidoreductase, short-chain dehydrogenase/reductase family [uncultured Segetibacter sp.]